MRRLLSIALSSLPALALMLAVPGCSGDEKKEASREPRERVKKTAGKAAEELTAATDGVIKGRVVIEGPAPKIEELVAAMEKHADSKTCLAGSEEEKIVQNWILAPDKKGVANVVIKLLPPADKKFKSIDPAVKEVVMDQPHCAFVPHVVALAPGQTLKMLNSAPVPHNTKAVGDSSVGNDQQSKTIPPGANATFTFSPQKAPIKIACDFHPWMTGQIFVNDSPYIAVTDKDGNFEIKNVPSGVELVVVGIHENGEVDGGKEGQKLTFKAGENPLNLKVKVK